MKLKLAGRRCRRDKRKNTFKQYIITLWNSLSQDLGITTNMDALNEDWLNSGDESIEAY